MRKGQALAFASGAPPAFLQRLRETYGGESAGARHGQLGLDGEWEGDEAPVVVLAAELAAKRPGPPPPSSGGADDEELPDEQPVIVDAKGLAITIPSSESPGLPWATGPSARISVRKGIGSSSSSRSLGSKRAKPLVTREAEREPEAEEEEEEEEEAKKVKRPLPRPVKRVKNKQLLSFGEDD